MTMDTAVNLNDDFARYLTTYPQEVAFGDEDAGAVFDRYHVPTFELFNNGIRLDRDRLLAHVRPARKNATSVRVDVRDVLAAADRVAASYTLAAVMRQGHTVVTEIYMFGQLAADGRLQRIDQITRDVPAKTP